MKGIIFVELIRMADEAFGEDNVDLVLDKANLDTGGAFTTVGNYPCSELVKIVIALSEHSGLSAEDLQRRFGHWMLTFFVRHYPEFFADKDNAFSLLDAVDKEIHVEVKKLYPDAELPRFVTRRHGPTHLEILYASPRPLEAFCHGLIEASLDHFREKGQITRALIAGPHNITRFDVTLQI